MLFLLQSLSFAVEINIIIKNCIAFTSIGSSLFYTPEEQPFLKVSTSLSPLPVNMLCIMKS